MHTQAVLIAQAVVLLWLSTGLIRVPVHARRGRDEHSHAVVARLVCTNWARTVLWSARAARSISMLTAAL